MLKRNSQGRPGFTRALFPLLAVLVAVPVARAADGAGCEVGFVDTALTDAFGSVSFMANLRGSDGSIRAVAKTLLAEAIARSADEPGECPSGCADTAPVIVYRVLPTAYLDADRQRAECRQFEQETTAEPLRFGKRTFTSLDDMNEWIMNFSRGKGDDGKALYAACSSNCSPRYTFLIETANDDELALEAEVVCGLARDKKVKQYRLSTALRSGCDAGRKLTAGPNHVSGGHGE